MTAPAAERKHWRGRTLRVIAWIALTLIVVSAVRSLDWRRTLDTIQNVRLGWCAVAVSANAMILVFWGAFWRALLPRDERLSFGRMFVLASVASAVMNTVPFLAGHATSAVLLVQQGVSQHGALTVLALDQLGEGMAKTIIFLSVALVAPVPAWMRAGMLTVSGVVAALFVVLVGMAHRYATHEMGPPTGGRLARAQAFVARWARGMEVLRSWRRSVSALTCVLAMKAVELVAMLAVQRSFGVSLSVSGTLLVLAATVLATMLPLVPGNVGAYEASAFLAYRHLGLPPEQAAALALVQHVCFMLPAVGVGYLLLSWSARRVMASP